MKKNMLSQTIQLNLEHKTEGLQTVEFDVFYNVCPVERDVGIMSEYVEIVDYHAYCNLNDFYINRNIELYLEEEL